jgi:hypothetical protein
MRVKTLRILALAMATLLVACTGSSSGGEGTRRLDVFPASYDLAAGTPTRFVAGVGTGENLLLAGGSVDMRFFFLGETKAEGPPRFAFEASGTFLPLPGSESGVPDTPTPVRGSEARGVYRAEQVTFDRAGLWQVEVTANLDREDVGRGRGAFEVLEKALVPTVGEPAPRTENLTLTSKGVPKAAIDSRAATGTLPDPELHRATIAEAIRRGRPALVVFATPVYCISRFCGPVTNMVADLAADYRDRADFIHVEIWKDFQRQVINEAAAQWLLRKGNIQEPWVFLIGPDGRISARWDNVATREEIEPYLRELPPLPGR